MIKLSECGFPRRRLYMRIRTIAYDVARLAHDLATHAEILVFCEKCQRHEAFLATPRGTRKKRIYTCAACSDEIEVAMNVQFAPFKMEFPSE